MTDRDRQGSSGAPPVPPERQPGDPAEDAPDDLDEGIKESEAEAEEDRVDAAPREAP